MTASAPFTHDEVQELLGPLADGELPGALEARARAHVAACARCARAIAVQEAVRRAVAGGAVATAPAALALRVGAALDAEEERSLPVRRERSRPRERLAGRSAARRALPWSGWAVAALLAVALLLPRAPSRGTPPATPPMIRSALVDYRRVSREVLPPACGDAGRPELPIAGSPLHLRAVSCWRTTLQGEAVSAWAYRWGDRVVVAYVVPEALFFRQPQVRDAVARDGRYAVSDGDASVVAWPAERAGVLVVGEAPVAQLDAIRL